jgi:serine/threonine protein kinase/tetratricopeptide (TPR) repeat protein
MTPDDILDGTSEPPRTPTGRWREVSAIVDAALELPKEARSAYVAHESASPAVRKEVEKLLVACERADGFLGDPATVFAAPLIQVSDARHRREEAAIMQHLSDALADRYAIEREVGHGGMALVYLARDVRHHREVAIKVLRPDLTAALGAERFLREIHTVAGLAHPQILPLLDSGDAGGLLYYVMPFVHGESLRDRLEREPQLPVADALQIARDVAGALDYAHRQNVLHRDLKPENVLLVDTQAFVADFGIACAITRATGDAPGDARAIRLTATGLSLGTPAYMSPEQALGTGTLDGRSDIYALGCLLYEMLAGQPPFTGPTAESVIRQHALVPAPALSVMREGVSSAVAAVVARALSKSPADRFATMAEFARALAAATARKERRSSPVSVPVQSSRRLAARALALVVLPLLLASGVGWAMWSSMHNGVADDLPLAATSPMRVAVFPFGVHASRESQFVGEAAMDLMSSAIDGQGELRRVDPRALMSRLRRDDVDMRDIDLEEAQRISRRFGAGRYVLGTATVVGGRVHLVASLYDVARTEPLASADRDRPLDELSSLVTDVTRTLFAAQPIGTGGRLTNIEAAQAANPEADRAYFAGEALLRRGEYDSAAVPLRRAVAADSTFALAWYRLALALDLPGYDAMPSIDRAMLHRDRLSPRDRLLVDAYHAFIHGDGARAERHALAALGDYPDHVEALTLLGAIRSWHGWQWGRSIIEAREPLERALVLDPSHLEAMHELYRIARFERRYLLADSIRLRTFVSDPPVSPSFEIAFGRGDPSARSELLAQLRVGPDGNISVAAEIIAAYSDDLDGAREVASMLVDSSRHSRAARAEGELLVALIELAAGRRAAAREAFTRPGRADPSAMLVYRAMFAVIPALWYSPDELRDIRDSLLHWTPGGPVMRERSWLQLPAELYPSIRMYLLGLVSARLGDRQAANEYATLLERARVPSDSAALLNDLALEIRAVDLAQAGDTARALATLARQSLTIRWKYQARDALHRRPIGRFLRAEMLFNLGRYEEALGWYDGVAEFGRPGFVLLAPTYWRMGEIHERLGNRERAIEYYSRFVARWRTADRNLRDGASLVRHRLFQRPQSGERNGR